MVGNDRNKTSLLPCLPLPLPPIVTRELLAFGNKREAVEWAMRNRAESHALYLAMLMDAISPGPTMGDVVARLEASLPANDPILTGKNSDAGKIHVTC